MGGKIRQETLEKVKERPDQIFAPAQTEQLILREGRREGPPGENPAPVAAQRTVTAVGPQFPQEAPPGKFSHKQILGKLDEKERTETHSDEQRMGVKQYLLDNVALDEKKKCSRQFKNILKSVREYAGINVTGDGDQKLLMKESSLLTKAMRDISSRARELRQEGVLRKNEMEELELLTIYEGYFKMDTGGYLEVPPNAELIDYGERELAGTYKNYKKQEAPITLKEVPREKPLFPHEPSVNDIAQGGLGDCYLLASLASVVHTSPQMIKDCMRDNGDGTVTVRFYKNVEEPGQPMRPVYVRVKKSVPEGDVYARGSLWVQMIEKAYAASGLHHGQETEISYNGIAGGTSDRFISRLTGKEAVREIRTKLATETDNYFDAMVNYTRAKQREKSGGNPDETALMAEVLGVTLSKEATADEIFQIGSAVTSYAFYFDTVIKEGISNQEQAIKFFENLNLNKLPDIIPITEDADQARIERNEAMKKTAVRRIRDFMLSFLPHEAFSGAYPPYAEELYERIRTSVRQGERVTASTEQSFKGRTIDGLNGEGVELGIASKHAYTVMGVKQLDQNKYIQLRNPWAHMGRSYERDTGSGKITRSSQDEGNHGIFLVELNEFITYYSLVRIL